MSVGAGIRAAIRKFHEETGLAISGIRLDAKTFGQLVRELGTRNLVSTSGPYASIIVDGYCEVWGEDED